jgi:glyoxylase-like metal-dependent hydrolase (beta-lactamase superfamily II)/ferredoxin
MASLVARLPANVAGDFFVDASCIDCGTCRWVAPASFASGDDASRVAHQPEDESRRRRAELALVACPVGAIGTVEHHDLGAARDAFPEPIDGPVHHCGYHAAASYGATAYLIVRPQGNILIDSPRFTADLVQRIEALGGVDLMFLTHRDDVADHARFHDHFGCDRILHAADVGRGTADVEQRIDGTAPCALDDEIMLIPAPGHTRGSVCLLYRDRFLFTGDHISWSPTLNRIHASREVCWYDWDELVRSVHRLLDYRFEWLLPGHGFRCAFPASRMGREMRRCLAALDASAA